MAPLRIVRTGDHALIEYPGEPGVTMCLRLDARGLAMSDRELRALHDQRLAALADALIAAPQVAWDERAACWRPRGPVVACAVEAGAAVDEPLVAIDDLELTLVELGRLLAGHGAPVRLLFMDE
jgi:hypothetical protein